MSQDYQADARRIIVEGDPVTLVESAKITGNSIARQLTTSQIRNIFGEVRQIDMKWQSTVDKDAADDAFRRVVLLQPKLAYQAKREKGRGVEDLRLVLDPCIDEIRKAPKDQRRLYFQRFVDFFEAILAYHKAAGGN